jgi:RNA polymerase sigma-70 factor, ECF subfamily
LDVLDANERFYQAVWPHNAMILRAALIQTGNIADAEDLAQETMVKAFRALSTFRDNMSIKAWLFTILRNTRIDRLRTTAGSMRLANLDDLPSEPAVRRQPERQNADARNPEELLNAFSDQDVIDGLKQISEELRWTLLLVDVEEMGHDEAAEILDVPVGTVKSRVHRGRAMLRHALLPLARERRLVRE